MFYITGGVVDQSTCPPLFFRCSNGECIPFANKCDGVVQCPDADDERMCSTLLGIVFNL